MSVQHSARYSYRIHSSPKQTWNCSKWYYLTCNRSSRSSVCWASISLAPDAMSTFTYKRTLGRKNCWVIEEQITHTFSSRHAESLSRYQAMGSKWSGSHIPSCKRLISSYELKRNKAFRQLCNSVRSIIKGDRTVRSVCWYVSIWLSTTDNTAQPITNQQPASGNFSQGQSNPGL